MNRLQLATLLSWADDAGLQGRKRLQKVVFFLQEAGCPLDCRFVLHHYGPYSRDVADACDEMVAAGLIEETEGPPKQTQYVYSLKPIAREALKKAVDTDMQQFHERGARLIKENIWSLELGSTILFFLRQDRDWGRALTNACEFKKVSAINESNQAAIALARQFAAGTH